MLERPRHRWFDLLLALCVQAVDDAVKALAAQKLCSLSRHGQLRERTRRQTYIASMGALPALLRAMKAEDPQCQHWSVQALVQLVQDNQEVADNFTDIGGISVVTSPPPFDSRECLLAMNRRQRTSVGGMQVSNLVQTPARLVPKVQAGALLLIDAVCNASRHGRRSLLRRQSGVRAIPGVSPRVGRHGVCAHTLTLLIAGGSSRSWTWPSRPSMTL